MPYPSLTRLLEPFGNFSPMGVLWYSVGASPGWERFAGCMELAAAVLLFVPWLSRLGAIVCVADAVQIFTLNMTYDVPVKLFSFHLILMSLFLLAPDMKMLVEAVVRRRPGHPALIAAQLAFAVYFISISAYSAQTGWHSFGGGAPKPPFYGIWNVDRMFVDGIERSPLVTDYGRVRRVVIQNGTALSLQRMDETFSGYPVKTFTLQRIDPDHLTVTGSLDGHTVDMRTSLVDRSTFLLVSRGFNWIQEYPFNR
jgi:hypothetical protein